jgi:transposase-like protein
VALAPLISERYFNMAQYVSDDKKQEIIRKVRDEGKKVSELAAEYSVSSKSIYTWLRDGVKGDNSALEIARLKRETEMLYGLLGKLTAEASRSKK